MGSRITASSEHQHQPGRAAAIRQVVDVEERETEHRDEDQREREQQHGQNDA
jgi:hypothetical protein